MSVAYGSHNSEGFNGFDGSPRSLTITKPTGLAAGDMLVCVRAGQQTGSADVPSGWTQLSNLVVGSNDEINVVAKVADSTDAAATNFTFTWGGGSNGGANCVGIGILYRFTTTGTFHVGACVVDTGTDNDGLTRTFTGGITQTVADAVLIMAVFIDGDQVTHSGYAVTTNNPTWTERVDANNAAGDGGVSFASATGPRSATGATGDFSVTLTSDSSGSGGVLVAIQEVMNATVTPPVVNAVLGIIPPSVAGNANLSPAVTNLELQIPAPTATASGPKWAAEPKPAPGTWEAEPKT